MTRLALLLAWMFANTAAAQVDRPVQVTLVQDACTGYDGQELATILQVELRAIGVQDLIVMPTRTLPRGVEPGLALIHLSCDLAATTLTVEVADIATGNQLKREMPFNGIVPEARPRALALAIAVLVETSWIEVVTRPPRSLGAFVLPPSVKAALRKLLVVSVADDEPPSRPPTAAKRDPNDHLFAVLLEGRTFPSHATGLLGLQLAYLPRLGPVRLWMSADAALGNVSLSGSNGTIADASLYWLSAGLGVTWVSETLPELGIGPYTRFGYALAHVDRALSFDDYPVRDGSSFTALLGVQALLRAALTDRTFALIALDLGYAVGGVLFLAEGRPWGLADVSVGLRLGLAR